MVDLRALLLLAAALLAPGAAAATERVAAHYELTWMGVEVGRFEARLTADEFRYRLAYAARTTGFLHWLYPFASAGASEGRIADPGPVPAVYVVESRRRDATSTWTVTFDAAGKVERIDLGTPADDERDPVPSALRKAPDPLALALRATRAAAPGARLEEVSFDGKRAIRFALACAEAEHAIVPDDAGLPIRSALSCTLGGDLLAGASRRWRDRAETERPPARLLLSREIAPGRYWPLRVEAETRFGEVIVQLSRYENPS
jgi:hypothetical protein